MDPIPLGGCIEGVGSAVVAGAVIMRTSTQSSTPMAHLQIICSGSPFGVFMTKGGGLFPSQAKEKEEWGRMEGL